MTTKTNDEHPLVRSHRALARDIEQRVRSALAADATTAEDAVELLAALADQLRRELEDGGVLLRPAV